VIYNGAHLYLGESVVVDGFQPWQEAIDKVEALKPRRIVCGHQNKQLDDDAERIIAETRQYLDDADEPLRTETTAVDFFNAMVERYPNHLARTALWAGASALYGVRDHPGEDIARSSLPAGFERRAAAPAGEKVGQRQHCRRLSNLPRSLAVLLQRPPN